MPITPIEIDYALLREYDDGNVSVTDLTVRGWTDGYELDYWEVVYPKIDLNQDEADKIQEALIEAIGSSFSEDGD